MVGDGAIVSPSLVSNHIQGEFAIERDRTVGSGWTARGWGSGVQAAGRHSGRCKTRVGRVSAKFVTLFSASRSLGLVRIPSQLSLDRFRDVTPGDPNMRLVEALLQQKPRLSFQSLHYDFSRNPLDILPHLPPPDFRVRP